MPTTCWPKERYYVGMSKIKADYVCPKCKNRITFTPKRLEKGVCPACTETLTQDEKLKIAGYLVFKKLLR